MQEAEKIWMNGELVDWPDARVHVLSHGLHYGTTVFEGIRAYDAEEGTAVFRLDDHLARLERSAAMYHMPIPYTREELRHKIENGVPVVGKKDPKGPTPPLYMPAWKDKIKGQEMDDLLTYLFSIAEKQEEW